MPNYAEDKMCTCGCPASEHHQSWFSGGGHWYEECEAYGWNERGGYKPVHPNGTLCYHQKPGHTWMILGMCDDAKWIEHCHAFTPVAIPLGPPKCCCHMGAAVSGEYPEFECEDCSVHRQGFGPTGYRCKRHKKAFNANC